jgi:hypothetical protein
MAQFPQESVSFQEAALDRRVDAGEDRLDVVQNVAREAFLRGIERVLL